MYVPGACLTTGRFTPGIVCHTPTSRSACGYGKRRRSTALTSPKTAHPAPTASAIVRVVATLKVFARPSDRAAYRNALIAMKSVYSAHVARTPRIRQIRRLRAEAVEQRLRLLRRHQRHFLTRVEHERIVLRLLEQRRSQPRHVLFPMHEQLLTQRRRLTRAVTSQQSIDDGLHTRIGDQKGVLRLEKVPDHHG